MKRGQNEAHELCWCFARQSSTGRGRVSDALPRRADEPRRSDTKALVLARTIGGGYVIWVGPRRWRRLWEPFLFTVPHQCDNILQTRTAVRKRRISTYKQKSSIDGVGIVDWNGQHFGVSIDYSAFGRCAAVFWTTVLLSAFIAFLILCGVRRERSSSFLVLKGLLGISLLAAAWHPVLEFFGPVWRATNDHDRLDAILSQSVSAQCLFSYAVCISGLALLFYILAAKDRSIRWPIAVLGASQIVAAWSGILWS